MTGDGAGFDDGETEQAAARPCGNNNEPPSADRFQQLRSELHGVRTRNVLPGVAPCFHGFPDLQARPHSHDLEVSIQFIRSAVPEPHRVLQ
jgi:hypothetical protein